MTPKGVLFVGNFLSSSGRNRTYSEELAERLEGVGWRVLTTSRNLGRLARLSNMIATTWRHRRAYEVAHVDVFSGSAFLWAELVCFELTQLGKPYVLTLRGGNLPTFARSHFGRVRRLLKSAAVVTAPSEYLRGALHAIRDDILVLPNAIDVSRYEYRERLRAEPRLVWLRAFHHVYNPVLAVDVLAQLGDDAMLTMIGVDKRDGSYEAVTRRARELGVAERLELIAGITKADVPSYLSRADIFLNTTNVDNSPVSVLEALASGLCVVSTDAGGLLYMIDEGNGVTTPAGKVEPMATAVRRILLEPAFAARISAGARQSALKCDWSHILPIWERVLNQVAHE